MIPKNMIRLFHPVIQSLQVAFFMLAVCGVDTVMANPNNSNTDEIFGGQILSLTEEKPELEPSNDPRFRDNKDGTVTDLKERLMWKKIDIYQEKKVWINWEDAQTFLEKFNQGAYASYSDWRLPTRKELKSLYEGTPPRLPPGDTCLRGWTRMTLPFLLVCCGSRGSRRRARRGGLRSTALRLRNESKSSGRTRSRTASPRRPTGRRSGCRHADFRRRPVRPRAACRRHIERRWVAAWVCRASRR